MKSVTTATELADTKIAVCKLVEDISQKLSASPQMVLVAYNEDHVALDIQRGLTSALPGAEILGVSVHRGLFTEEGVFGFGEPAIGAFAIGDHDGSVGTAFISVTEDANDADIVSAVQGAVDIAEARADRAGELPDLVMVTVSLGVEETVLLELQNIFGDDVVIVGATAGDNDIEGKWSLFSNETLSQSGVGIALFYTTEAVTHYIQSGFMPAEHSGVVTECEGRNIISIDGRPAQDVFCEWIGDDCIGEDGVVSYQSIGLRSFAHRIATTEVNSAIIEDYALLAPIMVKDGVITLAANPICGETLYTMNGEAESMHNRLSNVSSNALNKSAQTGEISGGIMVMCAGYPKALQEEAIKSIHALVGSFANTPTLGMISYGEQGTFQTGESIHGNWMISSTIFNT